MVVIRIGRNRSVAAWKIASSGFSFLALGVQSEVDHHDRVLLHDADQENDPDEGDDREIRPAERMSDKRPDPADGSVERIVIGWMASSRRGRRGGCRP
jgi:hypothetical protein